jgi:hypothetical protein
MTSRPVHLEANLEALFHKQVRVIGGVIVKLAPTERGVPDRLVILPGGRIYLVELKTTIGRVSPIQAEWHKQAAQRGVNVVLLKGREEIVDWIRARADELWEADQPKMGRPRKNVCTCGD